MPPCLPFGIGTNALNPTPSPPLPSPLLKREKSLPGETKALDVRCGLLASFLCIGTDHHRPLTRPLLAHAGVDQFPGHHPPPLPDAPL
jgi:hypothetical protein